MTSSRRSLLLVLAVLALWLPQGVSAAAAADPAEDLTGFSSHLEGLAEKCREATVGIVIPGGSMGSGVIINEKGLVLTAAHVLPKGDKPIVIVLSDGRQLKGKSLGVNNKIDSGMCRIDVPGKYPFAPVAPADTVWEGDWVVAFGHGGGVQTDRPAPMRLGRALHVSSASSKIRWITTDTTVISGDSGGPLFDLKGRVIGIHSNIGMSVLVNRHVPIHAYHAQWDELLKPGVINQPPMPAKPLIPGMQELPGLIQREIERRLKGDEAEAFKKKLDAFINKEGTLVIKPTQAAKLLGREDMLKDLENWQKKLDERRKLEDRIEGAEKGKGGADSEKESDVSKASEKTRMLILEKKRERLLEEIAEDMRRTHGKIAPHVLSRFDQSVSSGGKTVVQIVCRGKVVALGTVIRSDGYIITKASELKGPARVRIGEREYFARVVNGNGPNDLALLKISADNLPQVKWAEEEPELGSLLVVADADGKPLALGVVGVDTRVIPQNVNNVRIDPPGKPYLGVANLKAQDDKSGVTVGEVPKDGPAAKAGIQAKDIITKVNGQAIDSVPALIKQVGSAKIGDTIKLTVKRGDKELEIEVKLIKRPGTIKSKRPKDFRKSAAQVYSSRGGKLSTRRTGFAKALTHDAVIWAQDIGGPILNLKGEAIGINIARYGRTATYAIPADQAKQLVDQMMRGR